MKNDSSFVFSTAMSNLHVRGERSRIYGVVESISNGKNCFDQKFVLILLHERSYGFDYANVFTHAKARGPKFRSPRTGPNRSVSVDWV